MAFTTAWFYYSNLGCADMASAKSKSMGLDSSWLFLNPFLKNKWVHVSHLQLSFTSLLKISPPTRLSLVLRINPACHKMVAMPVWSRMLPALRLGYHHCPLHYCPCQNHDTSSPRPQGICLCRLTIGTQCTMFFEENKSWHKWQQ